MDWSCIDETTITDPSGCDILGGDTYYLHKNTTTGAEVAEYCFDFECDLGYQSTGLECTLCPGLGNYACQNSGYDPAVHEVDGSDLYYALDTSIGPPPLIVY